MFYFPLTHQIINITLLLDICSLIRGFIYLPFVIGESDFFDETQ